MKNALVASGLIALTAGALLTEALLPTESAEPDCPAAAPCTLRELVALPWSPDAREHHNGADPPPTTQMEITSGTTSAEALPPLGWLDDRTMPLRQQRRPVIYPADDAWMGYAAMQAQGAQGHQ